MACDRHRHEKFDLSFLDRHARASRQEGRGRFPPPYAQDSPFRVPCRSRLTRSGNGTAVAQGPAEMTTNPAIHVTAQGEHPMAAATTSTPVEESARIDQLLTQV